MDLEQHLPHFSYLVPNKDSVEGFIVAMERAMYAQQPLDALVMVLMYHQAIRMSLFDFDTNGCCDGIENYGVNRNQGAESSLSYLISYLTVLLAFEKSEKTE